MKSWPKCTQQDTKLTAITLSNPNWFSKLFHHWKQKKISNKSHTKLKGCMYCVVACHALLHMAAKCVNHSATWAGRMQSYASNFPSSAWPSSSHVVSWLVFLKLLFFQFTNEKLLKIGLTFVRVTATSLVSSFFETRCIIHVKAYIVQLVFISKIC